MSKVNERCPCCKGTDSLMWSGQIGLSNASCCQCGETIRVSKTPEHQVKILREALKLVDDHDEMHTQSWFDCGYHKIVDNALSETE